MADFGIGEAIALGLSTAVAAGGAALSAKAQQDSQSAALQAQAATQAKLNASDDKKLALFNQSLKEAEPSNVQANMAAAEQARESALAPAAFNAATDLLPTQGDGSSGATKNAIVDAGKTARTQLGTMARGRATLGGLGDAFQSLGATIDDTNARINEQKTFDAMDTGLLPLDLQNAARAGGGLKATGSLLAGLGTAGIGASAGLGGKLSSLWSNPTSTGAAVGAVEPLTGLRAGGGI